MWHSQLPRIEPNSRVPMHRGAGSLLRIQPRSVTEGSRNNQSYRILHPVNRFSFAYDLELRWFNVKYAGRDRWESRKKPSSPFWVFAHSFIIDQLNCLFVDSPVQCKEYSVLEPQLGLHRFAVSGAEIF